MREHDSRLDAAKLLHEFVGQIIGWTHWIIARVEESYVSAEHFSGLLGFVAANSFYFVESHSGLPPEFFGLAAFAIRKTQDSHSTAARRIERDGSACTPDEISGVRANYEQCGFGRGRCHKTCRRCNSPRIPGHRAADLARCQIFIRIIRRTGVLLLQAFTTRSIIDDAYLHFLSGAFSSPGVYAWDKRAKTR